jgi:hypothetical protein
LKDWTRFPSWEFQSSLNCVSVGIHGSEKSDLEIYQEELKKPDETSLACDLRQF